MSGIEGLRDWSCVLNYFWDWSSTGTADAERGQELYRLTRPFVSSIGSEFAPYGKDVISSKNRIRGRGRALNILLTSGVGKAVDIQGLAVMYTAGG